MFVLLALTHLGHECQDLLSLCDGMHVGTDETSVYTLIRKSFGENEVRTHVNSKGKSPLLEKFSEEDGMHDTASRKTGSPTHYQQAIPAPMVSLTRCKSSGVCGIFWLSACRLRGVYGI